jgi:hypothetical protein
MGLDPMPQLKTHNPGRQLCDLLVLFGCGDEIAPVNVKTFRRRMGEVIARAAERRERLRLGHRRNL